jgi:Arc/MetJ-type ribon-helix-helix transcriptional regulator
MRQVINISLPQKMALDVKKEVKSGNYATTSEFFRDLLRMWQGSKLYNDIIESEKEFRQGKGKKLRSLKNLR